MVDIIILGTAQDGGLPHIDCMCNNCKLASEKRQFRRLVSSIGICGMEKTILIDTTPNIIEQTAILKKKKPDKPLGIDAILITHLHIGHYIGLVQLGREAAATTELPVYATREIKEFLLQNKPFSYLIQRKQIRIIEIIPEQPIKFDQSFTLTPFLVPHRNEDGNTVGMKILNTQNGYSLIYIPDIDFLDDDVIERINQSTITLLDGTFYQKDEIERQDKVPHPEIIKTMEILGIPPTNQIGFIHFNHSNPVISNTPQRDRVKQSGYRIIDDFEIIDL